MTDLERTKQFFNSLNLDLLQEPVDEGTMLYIEKDGDSPATITGIMGLL